MQIILQIKLGIYTSQQSLKNEQTCNQYTNITIELIRHTTFEQGQFNTPHFQQRHNLQNPANRYGQAVVQSTHLKIKAPT